MAAWDDPVAHIRGLERRLAAVEALAEEAAYEMTLPGEMEEA